MTISVPAYHPRRWAAENTHIYHLLVLELDYQVISQRACFRKVGLVNGLILVNVETCGASPCQSS